MHDDRLQKKILEKKAEHLRLSILSKIATTAGVEIAQLVELQVVALEKDMLERQCQNPDKAGEFIIVHNRNQAAREALLGLSRNVCQAQTMMVKVEQELADLLALQDKAKTDADNYLDLMQQGQ